jgi:hypothetical protein
MSRFAVALLVHRKTPWGEGIEVRDEDYTFWCTKARKIFSGPPTLNNIVNHVMSSFPQRLSVIEAKEHAVLVIADPPHNHRPASPEVAAARRRNSVRQ